MPPAAPTVVVPPAPTPRKSRRNVFIIAGAAVLGLCLCAGICGLIFGSNIFKSITEKPKVESVIDQFMAAMADKDAAIAYALFSTRSKRHTNLADLEKLLTGNNYLVFEGYRNITVTNLSVNAAFKQCF